MKKLISIFIIIMMMSCTTVYKWDGLSIFKRERRGETAPAYLIMKGDAVKHCDLVYPDLGFGVVGNYLFKQDTLLFYSKYKYYSDSIAIVEPIPYVFLYKKGNYFYLTEDSCGVKYKEKYTRMK